MLAYANKFYGNNLAIATHLQRVCRYSVDHSRNHNHNQEQVVPQQTTSTAAPPKKFGNLQNMFLPVPGALPIKQDLADGFELADGTILKGNLIIVDNVAFRWKISTKASTGKKHAVNSFTKEVFRIFDVVSPKPELLVIGTGKNSQLLSTEARQYLLKLGIKVDQSSTKNAVGTYNILLDEGRKVALAALSNSM